MLRIIVISTCLFVVSQALVAQNDTLLYQDFQQRVIPNELYFLDEEKLDSNYWVNWNADEELTIDPRAPVEWFPTIDLRYDVGQPIPATDTNWVYVSISTLIGNMDGNRNWLITPPIEILDDKASLHWKSGPRQGPRYMDGYSVVVSTTNFLLENFKDTLFRQAQMVPVLPATANDPEGAALQVDSFHFYPADAYIHANGYTDDRYFELRDTNNFYHSILEPHSVDLSKYAGQTILIGFLHDSDDDVSLEVDDILVMGTKDLIDPVEEIATSVYRLNVFPNPVRHQINVSYELLKSVRQGSIRILDKLGRSLDQFALKHVQPGFAVQKIPLSKLSPGAYLLEFQIDGQSLIRPFVKKGM